MNASANGKVAVIGFFGADSPLLGIDDPAPFTVSQGVSKGMDNTYLRPPHTYHSDPFNISAGLIQKDGNIAPLQ
jgi:hypothetical protein